MNPYESTIQTASRSVQPFLYSSPVCQTRTDRHADTQPIATYVAYVAIGCIRALRAGEAA